jgi:hypothetical protein
VVSVAETPGQDPGRLLSTETDEKDQGMRAIVASTNCVGAVWWVWIVTVDSGLGRARINLNARIVLCGSISKIRRRHAAARPCELLQSGVDIEGQPD